MGIFKHLLFPLLIVIHGGRLVDLLLEAWIDSGNHGNPSSLLARLHNTLPAGSSTVIGYKNTISGESSIMYQKIPENTRNGICSVALYNC